MNDDRSLSVWTIYRYPRDYPMHYVARRFAIGAGEALPTVDIICKRSLAVLRREMELRGLYRMGRAPTDPPHIIESWL